MIILKGWTPINRLLVDYSVGPEWTMEEGFNTLSEHGIHIQAIGDNDPSLGTTYDYLDAIAGKSPVLFFDDSALETLFRLRYM